MKEWILNFDNIVFNYDISVQYNIAATPLEKGSRLIYLNASEDASD